MIDEELGVGRIGWHLYSNAGGGLTLMVHPGEKCDGEMCVFPADAELLKEIGEGFKKMAQAIEKNPKMFEAAFEDEDGAP